MTKSAAAPASVQHELPVIELIHPMPGFPDSHRFALQPLDETGVLSALRSLDHADLQFLVVPPGSFHPTYAPEIDDEIAAELELSAAEQALVLLVVHAGPDLASTTVNLRAPIVVNIGTSRAAQIVLEDVSLPVAAPILG
ncbi:flagellar assembly protein FliW [Nocardioides sp. CER19]|uniref:flagellar assembly protein FliW n=1 Tax=Nocardioides sp. CER19 TaxID=3038538 RepID=UPI00244CAAD5|nr:flagellar assembly protein FliW [Nocardioides sp. CER19]MDH2414652.1 flagellar assembly protein FliW [Nocardioides sp. CER19]